MISSLLDNDFYTFTVGETFLQRFPNVEGEWTFKCRNSTRFPDGFGFDLRREVEKLEGIKLADDELEYLKEFGVFTPGYLNFLKGFRFDSKNVSSCHLDNGEIALKVKAPLTEGMMYEVPLLATINELYFRETCPLHDLGEGRRRLEKNITLIQEASADRIRIPHIVDYGTRRRFSSDWQREVVSELVAKVPENILGTSNMLLSKQLGISALGTQSHQYYQAFQAMVPLQDSLCAALDTWLQVHEGRFAIALTDIIGSKTFYKVATAAHMRAFEGFRGDSGDNQWWLDTTKAAIESHGLRSQDKSVYLSNGLEVPAALGLWEKNVINWKDLVMCIGTKLTNDVGLRALNIVMKLTKCDGQPVAKLSDDASKGMCDSPAFITHLRNTYSI